MSRGLVLDTSALLAPLLREPGGDLVLEAAASGAPLLFSAVKLADTIGIPIAAAVSCRGKRATASSPSAWK